MNYIVSQNKLSITDKSIFMSYTSIILNLNFQTIRISANHINQMNVKKEAISNGKIINANNSIFHVVSRFHNLHLLTLYNVYNTAESILISYRFLFYNIINNNSKYYKSESFYYYYISYEKGNDWFNATILTTSIKIL